MTAAVETLVEGLGLRLNGAPIGFCSIVLVTSASGHRTLVDTGAHPTREVLLRALLDTCQPEVMTGTTVEIDADVEVRHLPGHRHGQLGVLARTAQGRVVCASDVAKNARELLRGEPVLSDPAMRETARASVAWVLAEADIVLPGHDRRLEIVNGVPVWNRGMEIVTTIY